MDSQSIVMILMASILLNIVLFRTSLDEYNRRRRMQKEAAALSEALRSVNRKPMVATSGLIPIFVIGLMLGFAVLLAIFLAN